MSASSTGGIQISHTLSRLAPAAILKCGPWCKVTKLGTAHPKRY